MKKITRTFLRSNEMMNTYAATMKERQEKGIQINLYLDGLTKTIKEFEHWMIIPNDFPYDAIATVNHMILPKRAVSFDWQLITDDEKRELELLKQTYLSENYDLVWENLPKGQTVPGNFHLHLLVLKREDM